MNTPHVGGGLVGEHSAGAARPRPVTTTALLQQDRITIARATTTPTTRRTPARTHTPTQAPAPTPTQTIRVAVIDPHPLMARSIATLLNGAVLDGARVETPSADPVLTVTACATGLDGIELVGGDRPDLAVIDSTLADWSDPLASVRALVAANVRVVLFTQDRRPGVLWQCMRAGVAGIVPKAADRELLVAVRAVAAGGTHLHAPDLRDLATRPGWAVPDLPRREREAVALLAEDLPLKTIARRMEVSPSTVREFLGRTRSRYDAVGRPAPTRADLLCRALEDGIVAPFPWLFAPPG